MIVLVIVVAIVVWSGFRFRVGSAIAPFRFRGSFPILLFDQIGNHFLLEFHSDWQISIERMVEQRQQIYPLLFHLLHRHRRPRTQPSSSYSRSH